MRSQNFYEIADFVFGVAYRQFRINLVYDWAIEDSAVEAHRQFRINLVYDFGNSGFRSSPEGFWPFSRTLQLLSNFSTTRGVLASLSASPPSPQLLYNFSTTSLQLLHNFSTTSLQLLYSLGHKTCTKYLILAPSSTVVNFGAKRNIWYNY